MEIQLYIQVNNNNHIIFISKVQLISKSFLASKEGHTELVKYLVSKGSDINVTNKSGETALQSG